MSADFSEILKRFILPQKPYEETRDVTVTDLYSSQKPDHSFLEADEVDEVEADAAPRNEFGTIFHRVMEYIVRDRARKSLSATKIREWAADLSAGEQKEILDSALGFWKSAWGREIRNAAKCYPELPFIYKTAHGILKGQIDLVYQKKDASWVILDYKTNRIQKNQAQHASGEYRMQLALYALVFYKLYGVAPKKGVLYFSVTRVAVEFEYSPEDFIDFEQKLEQAYQSVLR